MKSARPRIVNWPTNAPTGIIGFDAIADGGLPPVHTPLLVAGPGSGKTAFALQLLMHGARACNEPGIFIAFEENSPRIIANTNSFDWKLKRWND